MTSRVHDSGSGHDCGAIQDLTGATAVTVSGTGVTVSGLTVVNPTTVRATFTITAGATLSSRTVGVTTPIGNTNNRALRPYLLAARAFSEAPSQVCGDSMSALSRS